MLGKSSMVDFPLQHLIARGYITQLTWLPNSEIPKVHRSLEAYKRQFQVGTSRNSAGEERFWSLVV